VASQRNGLVRQPHFVMFEVLSLVVAVFRSCLVGSSPGGPMVGMVAQVGGWFRVARRRRISLQGRGIRCLSLLVRSHDTALSVS
jgi:hypothetical protein